jgi:hypothetical protein
MKDIQVGCVRFATIAVLGLLANVTLGYLRPATAESVRDACTHDAFRLCGNTIPNVERTKACLARHRDSLSPRCQAGFRSPREHVPDRSAQQQHAPDRSAQENVPDRSAQENVPDRSAQENGPDRSAQKRHYGTRARHYGYYRHYHRHRFHLFPSF